MGIKALLNEFAASATPPCDLDLDSCCNCPQHCARNKTCIFKMIADPVIQKDISGSTSERLILKVLNNEESSSQDAARNHV
jgi:hypothetical protein